MKKIHSLALLILAFNLQAQVTLVNYNGQKTADWSIQEHILDIDTSLIDSLLQLGYEDIQDGRFTLAEEMLTASILSSKNALEYAYLYRGLARFANHEYQLARIDFTRCLLINSQLGDAYFLRALTRLQLGEEEKAQIDFEKVSLPGNKLSTLSLDRAVEIMDSCVQESHKSA